MSKAFNLERHRLAIALAAFVAGCVVALAPRPAGVLERAELAVHDALLAGRAVPEPTPHLAVVLESEADLQRFGHPLSDERLAQVIELLLRNGAVVVGMDKYRDLPVAPGTDTLDRLLRAQPNVVWVSTFGDGTQAGVQPPQALRGTDRAACGDVVGDADGRVRRSLLRLDDGKHACDSLAFAIARAYLAARSTPLQFASAGGNAAVRAGDTTLPLIEEHQGPYATADMAGYQAPIQFRRPAIPVIRLGDLLDGKVAPDAVKGRAVIFGSDAASLRDLFDVPARAATIDGRLPGAVLHAHAASELIDAALQPGSVLALAPSSTTLALAVASAALVALLLAALDSYLVGVLVAGGWIVLLGAAAVGSTVAGTALAPLPAIVAALAAGASAIGLRAWREQRERRELMGFFGRQVSPEVAELIWQHRQEFMDRGRIPAQSVFISVLFADIRSYSSITEQLPPQVMIDWLNRAIGAMTDAVHETRGVVTRYVGDQVMAVWGSPVPSRTDAERARDARAAVLAGLAMGRRLDEVNAANVASGLPPTRIRAGIYSGMVIQGGLGTRERFEFTTLGDTVNTAARLESYALEDDGVTARVLIGGRTHELCGEHFETKALGALQLKGKAQTVEVYRVFSEKRAREGQVDDRNALDGPRGRGVDPRAARAGAGAVKGD